MDLTHENKTFFDLHTHTVASGHGSSDTIADLVKAARDKGLKTLGISDHGPATPGSARDSYFRSLIHAPKERLGVNILYGVELNVRDSDGNVDLPDDLIAGLDYCILSLHLPTFDNAGKKGNTDAMIKAMKHPNVRILGHPDDSRFPLEYDRLLYAARDLGVFPEVNNASLMPDAYRVGCRDNYRAMLSICRDLSLPVLLSSDSHGKKHVGDFSYALEVLEENDFPSSLVLNFRPDINMLMNGHA